MWEFISFADGWSNVETVGWDFSPVKKAHIYRRKSFLNGV
jgi:hypothetical protein